MAGRNPIAVLIFEPSGVINTGDAERSEFTAPAGARV
jgi:hypothetical protein